MHRPEIHLIPVVLAVINNLRPALVINGTGFSVRGVIEAARAVTNRAVPCTEGPRREGDATKLVSGSDRALRQMIRARRCRKRWGAPRKKLAKRL